MTTEATTGNVMTMAAAFGLLWVVTMALAGALGRALYAKLDAMETALEHIATTAQELAESHARVEERLAAVMQRVDKLERTEERRAG